MNVRSSHCLCLLALVLFFGSCKKIDRDSTNPATSGVNGPSFKALERHANNDKLLDLVLSGIGGYVGENEDGAVYMPQYTTPVNFGGTLSFATWDDVADYQECLNTMLEFWDYSESISYEDTPAEIYHLGDEPLNLVDSALNFASLRHKYEVNDFNNDEWADTAKMYIEREETQFIANELAEFRVGSDTYKHISNDIYVKIINSDQATLDAVRAANGTIIFTGSTEYFDNRHNRILNNLRTQGCPQAGIHFFSTSPVVKEGQTTAGITWTANFTWNGSTPSFQNAYWTLDFGDGTVVSYTGSIDQNHSHLYTFSPIPVGSSITYTIKATAKPVNPPSKYTNVCPDFATSEVVAYYTVTITNPNCLSKDYSKTFKSDKVSIDGSNYYVRVMMDAVPEYSTGSTGIQTKAYYKSKATLYKQRGNGKWRKSKPPVRMDLTMSGEVYRYDNSLPGGCSNELIQNMSKNDDVRRSHSVRLKRKFGMSTTIRYIGGDRFEAFCGVPASSGNGYATPIYMIFQ